MSRRFKGPLTMGGLVLFGVASTLRAHRVLAVIPRGRAEESGRGTDRHSRG